MNVPANTTTDRNKHEGHTMSNDDKANGTPTDDTHEALFDNIATVRALYSQGRHAEVVALALQYMANTAWLELNVQRRPDCESDAGDLRSLQVELDAVKEDATEFYAEREALKVELADAKQSIERERRNTIQAEQERNRANITIASMQRSLATVTSERDTVRREATALKARIDDLTSARDYDLDGVAGVRLQLQAAYIREAQLTENAARVNRDFLAAIADASALRDELERATVQNAILRAEIDALKAHTPVQPSQDESAGDDSKGLAP